MERTSGCNTSWKCDGPSAHYDMNGTDFTPDPSFRNDSRTRTPAPARSATGDVTASYVVEHS